jgi:Putative bacterial sensory transduction regulator
MIRNNEDLEAQLDRLEKKYERVGDGTYLVSVGPGRPPVAMRLVQPVLVLQVTVGSLVKKGATEQARLFRKLLELNATALLHAAFGLEGDSIVLAAALELDSVDPSEIEAALADIDMALAEQVPSLRELV